jgi:hypothetical protein
MGLRVNEDLQEYQVLLQIKEIWEKLALRDPPV